MYTRWHGNIAVTRELQCKYLQWVYCDGHSDTDCLVYVKRIQNIKSDRHPQYKYRLDW